MNREVVATTLVAFALSSLLTGKLSSLRKTLSSFVAWKAWGEVEHVQVDVLRVPMIKIFEFQNDAMILASDPHL